MGKMADRKDSTIHVNVSGADIADLAYKIANTMAGVPIAQCVVTLISLSIILQKPRISTDDLTTAIYAISQYITMLIGDVGEVT